MGRNVDRLAARRLTGASPTLYSKVTYFVWSFFSDAPRNPSDTRDLGAHCDIADLCGKYLEIRSPLWDSRVHLQHSGGLSFSPDGFPIGSSMKNSVLPPKVEK